MRDRFEYFHEIFITRVLYAICVDIFSTHSIKRLEWNGNAKKEISPNQWIYHKRGSRWSGKDIKKDEKKVEKNPWWRIRMWNKKRSNCKNMTKFPSVAYEWMKKKKKTKIENHIFIYIFNMPTKGIRSFMCRSVIWRQFTELFPVSFFFIVLFLCVLHTTWFKYRFFDVWNSMSKIFLYKKKRFFRKF